MLRQEATRPASMPIPDDVHARYALALADEIAAEMRHEAVNAFGALSALSFHLWRRIGMAFPAVPASPELATLWKTLNERTTMSAERLDVHFLETPPDSARASLRVALLQNGAGEGGRIRLASEDLDELGWDVAIDGTDLAALVLGLLVGARPEDGTTATIAYAGDLRDRLHLRLAPTPFAARAFDLDLPNDAASLGVRVAKRLANLWGGELKPLNERVAEGLVLDLPCPPDEAESGTA